MVDISQVKSVADITRVWGAGGPDQVAQVFV